MLNRRQLLSTAIAGSAATLVAACATGPNGVPELSPTVIDAIQSAVATAAQYIPAVESIVATAVSIFGPAYAGLVTIGSQALNTLIQALVNVVTNLTPPAASRLLGAVLSGRTRYTHAFIARVMATSPIVAIGTTSNGITVRGYRV